MNTTSFFMGCLHHPIKDLLHNETLALIYDTIESGHCACGGGTIACDGGKIGSLFVVKIAFPKLENGATFASV